MEAISMDAPMTTAAKWAAEMACGRPACSCGKTAQTGTGNTHCPAHEDSNPSLTVNVKDGKQLFHCQAGCSQEDVILALRERGLWANNRSATPTSQPRTRREWPAHDSTTGEFVSTHVRIDPPGKKKMITWEPGGVKTKGLALYRATFLTENPGDAVVVCEGEPAAEALATIEEELGIIAVGTVTGSSATPGDAALSLLLGRAVILWPDNDLPGAKHMSVIASQLHALGNQKIQILSWPDAPSHGGDAADAIEQGVDIKELLANALNWSPTTIDLAQLLDRVVGFLERYVVLTDDQLTAVALWVVHTHAFQAAECTPYLSINSAEKQSGKTRLLEVLELLVARPWLTGRVTAAALIRKVARDTPTLLLDETDAAFKGDKEYSETLRGVLNSGYRLGGVASICIKAGGNWDVVDYPVFCAKALAGIGKSLPSTVQDRSVVIEMRRKGPEEFTYRFKLREVKAESEPVHDALNDWSMTAISALESARPTVPEELDDRATDVWEPLLAIADMAGGNWPDRARDAALSLSAGVGREDDSLGVMLLKDIHGVLTRRGSDRMASADLVAALVELDESPWADLRGKPLDKNRLAKLLKPYAIKPRGIRLDDGTTPRGYFKEDFLDAWSRYIPEPATPATGATDEVIVPSDVAPVAPVAGKSEVSAWPMKL